MPPSPLDLPVLISQMPAAAQIANIEVAKNDSQKALFDPFLEKQTKKEKGKVEDVEKSETVRATDKEGGQQHRGSSGKRERKRSDADESLQEDGRSSSSPWTGNILNMKI